LHLDTNGNEINQPLIDVVNLGAISDIEKTSDGGYILTGSGFSFWGNIDSDPGFILKLNANLEPQWDSILANNQSQGTAVLGTSDGGLVMSGYNTSGMFLKKVAGITSNNENVLLENEVEINVYPNPSTDKLIFELPLEILTLGLSLELYDSAGQLLRSKRIDETKEILSFEGLATGSYSYVIREGNKPVQTGVVVRM